MIQSGNSKRYASVLQGYIWQQNSVKFLDVEKMSGRQRESKA